MEASRVEARNLRTQCPQSAVLYDGVEAQVSILFGLKQMKSASPKELPLEKLCLLKTTDAVKHWLNI